MIASPSRDLRWNPVTTPVQALRLIGLDSCAFPQNPQQKPPSCPHPQSGDWSAVGPPTSPRAPSTSQVQPSHTTATEVPLHNTQSTMSPSDAYWKWSRERDAFTALNSHQDVQQEERAEELGKELKPPEQAITRQEHKHELIKLANKR